MPVDSSSSLRPRDGAPDRRRFLAALLAAPWAMATTGRAWAQPEDPFVLGVASGDVTGDAVALWTRLAPRPLEPGGGMPQGDVGVSWEVARDGRFADVVARGRTLAVAELAHSVHVTVEDLQPQRTYWYRFVSGSAISPVGRTRTLPSPSDEVARLRFATACCQHWEEGHFVAYDALLEDEPDFVVHLGDFIYEVARGGVRRHERPEVPETVEDFRLRHAQYRTDASLQRALGSLPFLTTLDNHDAGAERPRTAAETRRRAAAYRAWYEHMPMREPPLADGALSLYRGLDLGDLLQLDLLDTRQHRDPEGLCRPVEARPGRPPFGFGIYRERCAGLGNEERRMLSASEEAALQDRLAGAATHWSAVASTVLLSPFALRRPGGGAPLVYEASWDAYPAQRERLLNRWKQTSAQRVVLSGDLHSHWALDVPADAERPDGPALAAEFLATSISSLWPEELDRPIRQSLPDNPHVAYYEGQRRGYQLHDVTPDLWQTALRTVSPSSVRRGRTGSARTDETFAVDRRRSGLLR
ncbi:MAG: alkaline phosphatase D family protein [Acidobacteriota bacterium]